jgi:hypothetical protein
MDLLIRFKSLVTKITSEIQGWRDVEGGGGRCNFTETGHQNFAIYHFRTGQLIGPVL